MKYPFNTFGRDINSTQFPNILEHIPQKTAVSSQRWLLWNYTKQSGTGPERAQATDRENKQKEHMSIRKCCLYEESLVVSSVEMSMSGTAGTADGFCAYAVQLAEDHGRTETLNPAGQAA